jgi:hypothetical protein
MKKPGNVPHKTAEQWVRYHAKREARAKQNA